MRAGERGSVIERQRDSIGGGDGNDAIGRSPGRVIPNHEEVVVVVDQLIGGWQTLAHRLAHGTDQLRVFRVELADETFQLPLGRGAGWRGGFCGDLHGGAPARLCRIDGQHNARGNGGTLRGRNWRPQGQRDTIRGSCRRRFAPGDLGGALRSKGSVREGI